PRRRRHERRDRRVRARPADGYDRARERRLRRDPGKRFQCRARPFGRRWLGRVPQHGDQPRRRRRERRVRRVRPRPGGFDDHVLDDPTGDHIDEQHDHERQRDVDDQHVHDDLELDHAATDHDVDDDSADHHHEAHDHHVYDDHHHHHDHHPPHHHDDRDAYRNETDHHYDCDDHHHHQHRR